MDGIHDLGGRQGYGPIDVGEPEEPFHEAWEARMLGIVRSMSRVAPWSIDWFRHVRELIEPVDYLTRPYYDQWLQTYAAMMVNSGVATVGELASGKSAAAIPGLAPPMTPDKVAAATRNTARFDRPATEPPRFTVGEARIDMRLHSDRPYVLQGENGYSRKSAQGQASYYYSQPHIAVSGSIVLDGRPIHLTGRGWLDREWSSQPLAGNQQGWDWFSLHLADGHALMLYRLRHADGAHWLSGSWIAPDGSARTLSADEIELRVLDTRRVPTPTADDPAATRDLPLSWHVRLPRLNREWSVRALIDDQWLGGRFPYWEGVVRVEGGGGGVGFMELTGYE